MVSTEWVDIVNEENEVIPGNKCGHSVCVSGQMAWANSGPASEIFSMLDATAGVWFQTSRSEEELGIASVTRSSIPFRR